MNISKKYAVLFSIVGLAAGTAGTIAMQTHAATTTGSTTQTGNMHQRGTPPAAAGNVTAINGNTLTVADKKSGTVYTVDASSATIEKFASPVAGSTTKPTPTTISVSGIALGDNVMVQGTVSGTTISASKIMDGMMMGGRGGCSAKGGPALGWGNKRGGQLGTVSSVSGNTITLTGKDGTTYTVDASKATVKKINTAALSDVQVGDALMVKGTTSGTTVTATEILDGQLGGPGHAPTTTSPPAN